MVKKRPPVKHPTFDSSTALKILDENVVVAVKCE